MLSLSERILKRASIPAAHGDCWLIWEDEMAELAQLEAENAKLKRDYYELIWEVAKKHQGETRHETARRYIRERENQEARVAMSNDALKEPNND